MVTKSWDTRNFETVPLDRNVIDPLLKGLLQLCTPHKHEHHIVNLIKSLDYVAKHNIEELEGNLLITVGTNPSSMFSCHMDIVGQVWERNAKVGKVDEIVLMTNKPKIKNSKLYNSKDTDEAWDGWIYGSKWYVKDDVVKYTPSTLGADDKVGVYILLKMIEKGIPGLYVFHVGEEVGAPGSLYLSTKQKDKFKDIQRAIAYDRAGYSDVIAFQRGGRCCSKNFSEALAEQLNIGAPPKERFKGEVQGVFTDTANYKDIIPECTNLSVGYFNQHGSNERLDYVWLKYIGLPAFLKVDYDKLPTKRDPKEVFHTTIYNYNGGSYSSNYKGINRKTWVEADDNTFICDLPLWKPSDGIPANARTEVLIKAIRMYMTNSSLADKESFAKEYLWNLDYVDILEKEIDTLQNQLKMLANKKKYGTIEDISIHQKRKYLQALLDIAKKITSDKYDEDAINNYCKNVERFLENSKDKKIEDQYSKKELKNFNKFIFTMAYCISLEDNLAEDTVKLLVDIQKFITQRLNEEGFDSDPSAFFKKPHIITEPVKQMVH